ncbi:MAG: nucleoside-diphosphate sugar epimerase/dehydratase [Chloroflexota bacterium]
MRLRVRYLLLIDLLVILLAAVTAFVIRYEALWRVWPYITRNDFFFITVVLVRPICYYLFGLYRAWWRYASVPDLLRIVAAGVAGSVIITALVALALAPEVNGVRSFSRSVLLLEWAFSTLGVGFTRFLLRLVQSRAIATAALLGQGGASRRVLIMGAGDAGAMTLREMQRNPGLGYVPVGFVDDDPDKRSARIYGVPVLGTRNDIPRLVRERGIDQVVIAMPTAPGSAIRQVREICQACRVEAKTVPGMYELLNGTLNISELRPVRIEDLLRREPVRTDLAGVESYLSGAVVLVTGAGGSIGSELCRQIAARGPRQLLLLGHGENSIHAIWMELQRRYPQLAVAPLIADVRDAPRMEALLARHRPQVIFHAAAHKHVPLMEWNPEEAFTTNVLGTRNVLRAAELAGAEHFVLISSDKAVNPMSLMGASKRLAEFEVQQAARRTGRHFDVVRFGNVLGSRGSVVPLFEHQIAEGGPVTVTHPDMTRFFMTIPEAVQLVLQAAHLGHGGDVFVLDMGEQIRIVDLARDLIALSGLRPDEDIQIVFTGVRPGEKLREELYEASDTPLPTQHAKIWRIEGGHLPDEEDLARGLETLLAATRREEPAAILTALRPLIPSFAPDGEAVSAAGGNLAEDERALAGMGLQRM